MQASNIRDCCINSKEVVENREKIIDPKVLDARV